MMMTAGRFTAQPALRVPALSRRGNIAPFIAMDVMREANALDGAGADIVHLEVGQPGAPTPRPVIEAARAALVDGRVGYTEALGIRPLRERIALHYAQTHGVCLPAERIAVTTGSSGGFILAFLAVFEPGARVALPTPAYPAYRNILDALGVEVVTVETSPTTRWVPTPDMIEAVHAERPLSGLLLASPANPSGTMIFPQALEELARCCDRLGLWLVSDEIYHGLTYDAPAETALRFSEGALVINSFSKYFCMTGWRVGWMVLPETVVRTIERLAQNLYISVPTVSQLAALAAFDAREELEQVRLGYARNRALLLEALPQLGMDRFLPVDGAFYVYADVSRFTNDSMDFARRLLHEARVAVTPGRDFDAERGNRYIRLSFAGTYEDVAKAVERLDQFLR
jgi:aspartate/methionine/tyrosine aminotransferase